VDRFARAFRYARREGFLPPRQVRYAAEDRPLDIGHGQTNSQPSTVAAMLRLLDPQPGQRILDVGSGSAWSTALLAVLVGPDGSVHGVEVVPELVEFGRANLDALELPWASVSAAEPGVLGLPPGAPYDAILVSAESGSVPEALVRQLAVGGVMVVPVAGRMAVVRRTSTDPDAEPDIDLQGHYMFVPLVDP
jgi:protein-L-isoaspartate(D-aspartate) O-methyltransferase